MPITEDAAVRAALAFLEELPRLKAKLPAERLEAAIRRIWPEMPPPLILWLITAGLPDLVGRESARRQLYGLGAVMLQNEKGVLVAT